ncbi:MAG: DNA polymerase III subunit beta [Alphaproteobacteria bacterium]
MKLTIERATFLKALTHVQSVVERRNTIPILSNVRLQAGDGSLSLTATDLDLAVVETVPAEVQAEATTTAPAHTLYDICRKLPEGAQVELDSAGEAGRLVMRCGPATFTLPVLPTEDFPVMAEGDLTHEFSLAAEHLRRLIDKTRFAISTEETRYYLNGIYFHAADSDGSPTLRAVATDGHRLARVEVPLPEGAAGMPGVIVPRKTVTELRKLIDEADEAIAVGLSETKVRVAFDRVVLTSKLIDGTFPDYERVIPSGNDKIMEIDGKAFAAAVDRVSTISTEKSRSVKLSLGKGRLVLSVNSPESGNATEELAADYDAPAMEIGFNSRYVLDMAGTVDGDRIQFAMADAVSPTLVRDTGDQGALYVLMPMRV